MQIANVNNRLALVVNEGLALDVAKASGGWFSSEIQDIYDRWDEFEKWAASADTNGAQAYRPRDLGAPTPSPKQVFAIGLNYDEHATEAGYSRPDSPAVFTKFPSSLSGPNVTVQIPSAGHTDWEVELVAVIGRVATDVPADRAWEYVAGLTVGQDISERRLQLSGPVPQFSLAKSYPNFGPLGPVLLTPDEFEDRDDIEFGCSINGIEVQRGRTKDLIFSVPELIEHLSGVLTLNPGDIIFTGTPSGVGMGRHPQVWLQPGDVLTSWAAGIGEMNQTISN
jgi:2,4-diketo-3-deoxy-L-fuconate hydrolase